MNRPHATISVDVDPIEFHLASHGFDSAAADSLAYTTGLGRIGEIFDRLGVRATFFVAGRDATAYARSLRALLEAGHEIASHSFSRPLAFSRLEPAQMRDELLASKNALEATFGIDVTGFRAPNGDQDERGIAALLETGYHYDASAYPTPLLATARLARALRGGDVLHSLKPRTWPFTFERSPHVWGSERTLIEFPVSVTRHLRLPIDHDARFALDGPHFEARLDALVERSESLVYPLHAIDALGLAEDRLDPRLACHPGMRLPLASRLRLLEDSVRAIADRFEVVTFGERVSAVESCGQGHDGELHAA